MVVVAECADRESRPKASVRDNFAANREDLEPPLFTWRRILLFAIDEFLQETTP